MKKLIYTASILCFALITLASCNSEQSLQEYYIDNQENKDFIFIDLPASIINEDQLDLTADQKEVMASVRKINLLAYPVKKDNTENFKTEMHKVSTILKNDSYQELVSLRHDNNKLKIYYLGEEDAIDEVIAFVSDASRGFAVARLLGDDMNLSKIAQLTKSVGVKDLNLDQFDTIMDVFSESN